MIDQILAPVDGSGHSKRALELACDLAIKYDARLHLLHVLLTPTADLALPLGGTSLTADNTREQIEEAGQMVMEAAKRIALDNGCRNVEASIAGGPAAQLILEYAKSNQVDMIIMGNRGLSDIAGFMVGRVKHKVSDLAECICVTVP